jgi:hypothetical protein
LGWVWVCAHSNRHLGDCKKAVHARDRRDIYKTSKCRQAGPVPFQCRESVPPNNPRSSRSGPKAHMKTYTYTILANPHLQGSRSSRKCKCFYYIHAVYAAPGIGQPGHRSSIILIYGPGSPFSPPLPVTPPVDLRLRMCSPGSVHHRLKSQYLARTRSRRSRSHATRPRYQPQ